MRSAYAAAAEGGSRPVLAAPAAFLAIGRRKLAMLGGPAAERLPAGGVDLDLGLRLRRLGLPSILLGGLEAVADVAPPPAGETQGVRSRLSIPTSWRRRPPPIPRLRADRRPLRAPPPAGAGPGGSGPGHRRLLGVLLAIHAAPELSLKVVVSRWLQRESPRTEALLRAHRLPFAYVRRRDVIEGRAPSLGGTSAVLAAAESSHPAHAAGTPWP